MGVRARPAFPFLLILSTETSIRVYWYFGFLVSCLMIFYFWFLVFHVSFYFSIFWFLCFWFIQRKFDRLGNLSKVSMVAWEKCSNHKSRFNWQLFETSVDFRNLRFCKHAVRGLSHFCETLKNVFARNKCQNLKFVAWLFKFYDIKLCTKFLQSLLW